jgi:hypothetical protein
MELSASNMAACTVATMRCACGDGMRGATMSMAFSSQSVMTLARTDAGMATASDAPIKAAGIERLIDARMFPSMNL